MYANCCCRFEIENRTGDGFLDSFNTGVCFYVSRCKFGSYVICNVYVEIIEDSCYRGLIRDYVIILR